MLCFSHPVLLGFVANFLGVEELPQSDALGASTGARPHGRGFRRAAAAETRGFGFVSMDRRWDGVGFVI